MTRKQRSELAAARADLILADEPAAEAYRRHFEAQLRRGKLSRLLYAGYVNFARAGAGLSGLDAMKERSLPLPGGCWKVRSIRLHQA